MKKNEEIKQLILTLIEKIHQSVVDDMNDCNSICNGYLNGLVEAYNFYCDENKEGWDKLLSLKDKNDLMELIYFGADIEQLHKWKENGAFYIIPSLFGGDVTFTMITSVGATRNAILGYLDDIIKEMLINPECVKYQMMYNQYIGNVMSELYFN